MTDLTNLPVYSPSSSLAKEYSVSEIAYNIKNTLEQSFNAVRIRGEISGAKFHTSGHLYCALKDSQAVLDAVCWRGTVKNLSFQPEDGMEVIASGRITTYAGRSKYQLIIDALEIAGEGALLKTLEDRKKRLAAEGLFDADRKRLLPFFPRCIGVITSPTGAVIRDILHRLQDRFPTSVLLWPVLVQGEGAAAQIVRAIQGMNQPLPTGLTRPDLIIVARGGGSLEDLWAFNEENVVRAAAASKIPLISAIGHETDTTLIDYAADWRAPTPTAAAERAVPVRRELLQTLIRQETRLNLLLKRLYEEACQRTDDNSLRLENFRDNFIERLTQILSYLSARLRHPQGQIILADHQLRTWIDRFNRCGQHFLKNHSLQVSRWTELLESYSYQNTLKRGFCAVKDDQHLLVSSKQETIGKKKFILLFQDGTIDVHKTDERETSTEVSLPSSSKKISS